MPTRSLSQVLQGLSDERPMSLGDLLATFGSRAHGCALLLLGLPDSLPLPMPSASAVLGVPLVLVSAHLALYGEAGRLPRRVRGWSLPPGLLRVLHRYVAPILRRVERMTRARWQGIAARERLLGLVCLYLSIMLLLPLPFFNTPPSLCLVLLAWGMVQRDGAFVVAGLAGTIAVTAGLAYLAVWARSLLG